MPAEMGAVPAPSIHVRVRLGFVLEDRVGDARCHATVLRTSVRALEYMIAGD